MPPLNTPTDFRNLHRVDSYASGADIEEALWSAYDELGNLVKPSVWADAILAIPTDAAAYRRLKRAERFLAYGKLVYIVGSRLRREGIVTRERRDNENSDDSIVDYADFDELEKFENKYRNMAVAELRVYLLEAEVFSSFIPVYRG